MIYNICMNKTVLCIVDGLGVAGVGPGNAVELAGMTNFNSAKASGLYTEIKASGPEVGLVDEKDAGNSEVGHNAIGSGQYIKQGLALLNEAFKTGEIYKSEGWIKIATNAKKTKLNIIILLSDGRTHSDIEHLFKVLEQCKKEKIDVSIHALADGRDVSPQSVLKYIDIVHKVGGKIATVAGRGKLFMDRYESNINLYIDGIRVCVGGEAPIVKDIHTAINAEYKKNPTMTDETLPAFILEPELLIKNGDSVLLLNYRGDRAVGTCKMFETGRFLSPEQYASISKCVFAGIMQYDAEENLPKTFLCPPATIKNGLTEWLCKYGVRQYSVTETVKFGHLTYFFNGNRAKPFDEKLETWKEFKSDICHNMYNTAPKMQAVKITDDAINALESGKYDFIKLNLSNPDMVGHTGDIAATIIACKTVDECLGKLATACKKTGAHLVITSDHGNAETMLQPDGKPLTSHTNTRVPFVLLSPTKHKIKDGVFGLTNIASSICLLLGVPVAPSFNESII